MSSSSASGLSSGVQGGAERLQANGVSCRMRRAMRSTVLAYTVAWLVLALTLYATMWLSGRTLIWLYDGMYQHFNSFNYLCDYLNALFTGNPAPQFNYTLGQGLDVLSTLGPYDFTDPVACIFALLPLNRVVSYTLMVFAKTFLAGLSFIVFMKVIGFSDRRMAIVCGAVMYAFSGTALCMFARHPNFESWTYCLPLIMSGVELLRKQNRARLLVPAVCLNVVSSFYTFYIDALLLVVYMAVRAGYSLIKERTFSCFTSELKFCLKVMGCCIVGVLLASAVLLPQLFTYLQNARFGTVNGYLDSWLLYPWEYYANLFTSFFTPLTNAGYSTCMGLAACMIVPIFVLFISRGEHTMLKAFWVVAIIMLCVPFVGSALNGFGYCSNRWCFAVQFLASVTLVVLWPKMLSLSKRQLTGIAGVACVYSIIVIVYSVANFIPLGVSSAIAMIVFMALFLGVSSRGKPETTARAICVTTMLLLVYQIVATFAPFAGNYAEEHVERGAIEQYMAGTSAQAAADLEDEGFYRVDKKEQESNRDNFTGVQGTDMWWSILPVHVVDYYNGLGLNTVPRNCSLNGLGHRTTLLSLASVNYYTRPTRNNELVPFGLEMIDSPNDEFQIMRNTLSLPIGYTYDCCIDSESFKAASALQKEQMLAQGAVVDSSVAMANDCSVIDPTYYITGLPYMNSACYDASLEPNVITSYKNGAIDFLVDVPEGCEVYFVINKPELKSENGRTTIVVKRKAEDGSASESSLLSSSLYNWHIAHESVVYDLGYGGAGENTVSLTFKTDCMISFDSLSIVAVPIDRVEVWLADRSSYVLRDVEVGCDRVTGTINVPNTRVLQFSIPYSEGWSATIDNEPAELFQSGGMYMGMVVPPGQHSVELRYATPWLAEGFLVSLVTLIGVIVVAVALKLRSRSGAKLG